jgi:hypothetical protein
MKLDNFRVKLYKEAMLAVMKILLNLYNNNSISKIKDINKLIKKQNNKKGFDKRAFLINLNVLQSIRIHKVIANKRFAKDPKDKDIKKSITDLAKQLQITVQIKLYPSIWLDFILLESENSRKG